MSLCAFAAVDLTNTDSSSQVRCLALTNRAVTGHPSGFTACSPRARHTDRICLDATCTRVWGPDQQTRGQAPRPAEIGAAQDGLPAGDRSSGRRASWTCGCCRSGGLSEDRHLLADRNSRRHRTCRAEILLTHVPRLPCKERTPICVPDRAP